MNSNRKPPLLACLLLLQVAAAQVANRPVVTPGSQSPAGLPTGTGAGAPGPVRAGGSAALSPEYKIGPYDVLQVTVWKEQQLSGTFPVRPDGMISLVLLGDVPAAGMTPVHLAEFVTDGLKKYIQDPLVTVVVTAVNSQKVYVLGEVAHVGPVDLSPGMTPLEAIAASGGLNTYANAKHAYILRGTPGKQKKIPFDYKKALKGQPGQSIVLETGDTVVIP